MDFLALDFETATPQPDSPCELGIAIVRGGVVREVRNWLIKPKQWPYFSPWNVAVHGIRPGDVASAPNWKGIWDEVRDLLEGSTVVAHNAAFDMGVLRATLASEALAHPSFDYFCSVTMSKLVWPGHASYGLKAVCDRQGIALRHHRAGNDAHATAEVVLRAAE
ncbi:MAG TPA: 3'-5' exonuclease, partial [Flavobacteriales bacterium]|nr:3'-5' exonuclease [Flavobacteriales bacterium]